MEFCAVFICKKQNLYVEQFLPESENLCSTKFMFMSIQVSCFIQLFVLSFVTMKVNKAVLSSLVLFGCQYLRF